MILWMNNRNQNGLSAKGLQPDDEPEFFDFETEAKWRAKLQKSDKSTLPIKTTGRPGKILEFKRNK